MQNSNYGGYGGDYLYDFNTHDNPWNSNAYAGGHYGHADYSHPYANLGNKTWHARDFEVEDTNYDFDLLHNLPIHDDYWHANHHFITGEGYEGVDAKKDAEKKGGKKGDGKSKDVTKAEKKGEEAKGGDLPPELDAAAASAAQKSKPNQEK